MGTRGPVPKHSSERRRRNAESQPDVIPSIARSPQAAPDLGFPVHKLVGDWYASLAESAQSQFYQPSDWQYARIVAFELNRLVNSARPSAQMFAALDSAMGNLLVTEGARRRVRVEIERDNTSEEEATVLAIDFYRNTLGG